MSAKSAFYREASSILNPSKLQVDIEIMPSADQKPRTLYDKVFQDHIVDERDDGTILLYIGTVNVYISFMLMPMH